VDVPPDFVGVAAESLDLHVAGMDLEIRAPRAVLDVLEPMLAHVPRKWTGTELPLRIDVRRSDDVWHVSGRSPKSAKVLGGSSALPRVAGATIASALIDVAQERGLDLWRAAVLERNGQGLALVGDDWESGVTLTAHLHTRGWRIVAGDYALVSRDRLVAHPFRKALYSNSSSIGAFPLWYRAAVEASPWYTTAHVIAFYAIDPSRVTGGAGWGELTPVRAIVNVDGRIAEHPALEIGEPFSLSESLRSDELARRGVATAGLVLGGFVESCDLLERWFESACGADQPAR
jgi:hypothetical protein